MNVNWRSQKGSQKWGAQKKDSFRVKKRVQWDLKRGETSLKPQQETKSKKRIRDTVKASPHGGGVGPVAGNRESAKGGKRGQNATRKKRHKGEARRLQKVKEVDERTSRKKSMKREDRAGEEEESFTGITWLISRKLFLSDEKKTSSRKHDDLKPHRTTWAAGELKGGRRYSGLLGRRT